MPTWMAFALAGFGVLACAALSVMVSTPMSRPFADFAALSDATFGGGVGGTSGRSTEAQPPAAPSERPARGRAPAEPHAPPAASPDAENTLQTSPASVGAQSEPAPGSPALVRSPEPPPPASDNASIRADAAPTGPPPPPAPRAGTEAAGTAPFEPAAEAPNGEVGEPASPAPPNAAAEGAPSSAAFATGAAPREAEPAEAAPAEAAPAEEAEAVVAVLPPPFAPTLAPRGDGSAPPSPTQAGRACSPVFEVYFQRGSSEPHMRPHVAEVAALRDRLAGNRTAMVLIEGHADAKGPEDYNFKLSEQRARAVADALISAGFDERRLLIDFRGELEPVAGLHPLASLNRRAVVRAGSTAGCRALHAKRSQN